MAIQRDMNRGIINTRALAKHIIKQYGLRASLDSVISAIRRFESLEKHVEEEKTMLNIFKDAVVSTKNNMACITLELMPREFFQKLCMTPNSKVPLKVSTGTRNIKVLFENPHLKTIKALFDAEDILSIEKNLSEISVKVSEQAVKTKGVLARIANELAVAHINVEELVVIPPEFLIYVKQKDIVKAHEAIITLAKAQ